MPATLGGAKGAKKGSRLSRCAGKACAGSVAVLLTFQDYMFVTHDDQHIAGFDSLIGDRIKSYKQALKQLDVALDSEMKENFHQRRFKHILFLALEKKRYSFALSELESLLLKVSRDPR